MPRDTVRLCAIAAVLFLTAAAGGAIEFDGPEVIKIGWSSGALTAADIDGDGRTDLAILNNDRARIELLLQRTPGTAPNRNRPSGLDRWQPVLEDSRFERRGIPTGGRMYALAAGDLDGDGRVDLAFTGSPGGLSVRFQDKGGGFDREQVFDISEPAGLRGTVATGDLDGDGRTDLAVLTKEQLLLYRQSAGGDLAGPERWRLSDGCFALEILDVDGDSRMDIFYQVSGTEDSLRVRHGLAAGGFGPEIAYRPGPSRGVVQTMPSEGGRGSDFVRIQADTGLIEKLAFEEPESPDTVLSNARPRVFAFPTDGKAPARTALGDFDGNGLSDFAVADPRGARIWLVSQTTPGIFTAPVEFPTLAGIRELIAIDRDEDGRDELIMASPKEHTLAWTRLSADGVLELPSVIPTQGKPETVAAGKFDGDAHVDLVYASVDKRDRRLFMLSGASNWIESVEIEIADLETDPAALRVADLNGDTRSDLVLFVDHDPLRLLIQNGGGGFTEIEQTTGFGRSLVSEIEPSAFSTGDVTGDGIEEMIIAGSGFARALRLNEEGSLEVVAQFNPRSGDAEIAAASILGAAESGGRTVALLDPTNDHIHILTQQRGKVWRFTESLDLPAIDLTEVRSTDLDGSGTDDLVLLGTDRLVWLPIGLEDPVLRPTASWECDLEGVTYQLLGAGDLDSDGNPEIVAVDSRDSHVLEVLRPGPDGDWTSLLHFTVFEVDPHYEGQRGAVNQPREIVIADLTGDGRQDLVLVAHDRILLYPQTD